MILNVIWVSFFLVGFAVALVKLIFFHDMAIFPAMLNSTFDNAKTGFEISLYLTGVMSLWLGFLKIGEKGGMIAILSRWVGPFFTRIFPDVPKNHPAFGSIIMNFSANMLGLDNAATPIGLKAMKELQELNPSKTTASDAQLTFVILHASSLTLIPITVIADRVALHSTNPTSIFVPTLIAMFCATVVSFLYVAFKQRIKILDPVLLGYLLIPVALIVGGAFYFSRLPPDEMQAQSNVFSSVIMISVIASFLILGVLKKVPLFETFVEGAKEGFETSVRIIPYLVGILFAIGIFKTSGALDYLKNSVAWVLGFFLPDTRFVEALPVAFLKPLSGSGARAMMISIADPKAFGPDSFVGNLSAMFRGCAETTFYLVAVYFGSINIRNTRYAVAGGLIADLAGFIAAIFVAYFFFGAVA